MVERKAFGTYFMVPNLLQNEKNPISMGLLQEPRVTDGLDHKKSTSGKLLWLPYFIHIFKLFWVLP